MNIVFTDLLKDFKIIFRSLESIISVGMGLDPDQVLWFPQGETITGQKPKEVTFVAFSVLWCWSRPMPSTDNGRVGVAAERGCPDKIIVF